MARAKGRLTAFFLASWLSKAFAAGAPATRAAIIAPLKKRHDISVEKGKFVATEAEIALIDALPDAVTQPDMTAVRAEKQAAIETGEISFETFIDGLYGEISRQVESADINISAAENPAKKQSLRACPSIVRTAILRS